MYLGDQSSGVTAPEVQGGGVILPLLLNMECTATEKEMNGNVSLTLERGYVPFMELLDREADKTVSLCGAGPSLSDTLDKLKGDVFAVNSAIGVLLDRGIVPKYAMIWDCAEICEKFAVPHPDVTYLVASRCHPAVFERLKDCRVVVWHADGDHNILPFLEEKNVMEPLVKGGTTGITRGLYVAYALGYRDFHVFGADSSYRNGESHVNGSLVYEHRIKVMVNKRWFDSTPQWAAQIEELKVIYPMFRHTVLKAQIEAYDDGMFGYVLSIMKQDEEAALNNAIATLKRQEEAKGQPIHGVPGVLPSGSIAEIQRQNPDVEIPAMKTLQPLSTT